MSKQKKRFIGILAAALLLCCIPMKMTYKDGGTVKYQALLWSYTRHHRLMEDGGFFEGTEFCVFPFNFL